MAHRWRSVYVMNAALDALRDAVRRGGNPDPVYWIDGTRHIGWIWISRADGFDAHVKSWRKWCDQAHYDSHVRVYWRFRWDEVDRLVRERADAMKTVLLSPLDRWDEEQFSKRQPCGTGALSVDVGADMARQFDITLPAFVIDAVNAEFDAMDDALILW